MIDQNLLRSALRQKMFRALKQRKSCIDITSEELISSLCTNPKATRDSNATCAQLMRAQINSAAGDTVLACSNGELETVLSVRYVLPRPSENLSSVGFGSEKESVEIGQSSSDSLQTGPLAESNQSHGQTGSDKSQKHSIVRAVLVLTILLVFCVLATVLLGAPKEREVHLSADLDSYTLPEDVSLELPEIARVHLRGSTVWVTGIRDLSVASASSSTIRQTVPEVTIEQQDGVAMNSVLLEPLIRRGLGTVVLPRGTVVQVPAAVAPGLLSLSMSPPNASPIALAIAADKIRIKEANRVLTKPLLAPATPGTPTTLGFTASNSTSMVQVRSVSNIQVELSFTTLKVFSLLPAQKPLLANKDQPISLRNCRVKEALLHGVKDSDMGLSFPSNLDLIPGEGFQWTIVSASAATDSRDSGSVRLLGHGKLKSLTQDGRQILPTRVSDLLGAEPAKRGFLGAVAVFFLFAGGVFMKRAMDIIAKVLLPE